MTNIQALQEELIKECLRHLKEKGLKLYDPVTDYERGLRFAYNLLKDGGL